MQCNGGCPSRLHPFAGYILLPNSLPIRIFRQDRIPFLSVASAGTVDFDQWLPENNVEQENVEPAVANSRLTEVGR